MLKDKEANLVNFSISDCWTTNHQMTTTRSPAKLNM